MDDAEFQKLLNAEPPVSIKFGLFQTLLLNKEESIVKDYIIKDVWCKKHYWKDVSEFIVRDNGKGFTYLLFNDKNSGMLSAINRLFLGYDQAITTAFKTRTSFDKLANLLNHWRLQNS